MQVSVLFKKIELKILCHASLFKLNVNTEKKNFRSISNFICKIMLLVISDKDDMQV